AGGACGDDRVLVARHADSARTPSATRASESRIARTLDSERPLLRALARRDEQHLARRLHAHAMPHAEGHEERGAALQLDDGIPARVLQQDLELAAQRDEELVARRVHLPVRHVFLELERSEQPPELELAARVDRLPELRPDLEGRGLTEVLQVHEGLL